MQLKVGLINDSFPPTIDGVANAVFNYADIISKKHGTPVVITPKYPHIIDNYNFEVYRFSSIDFKGKMPYRVGNPFSPITLEELKRKNMDILHVHCPFSSGVMARQINNFLGRRKRVPVVFTYHTKFDIDLDKYVKNPKMNKIARKFVLSNINSADEVWSVSEGGAQNLREFGYKGNIRIMPNGTDFPKGKAPDTSVQRLKNMFCLAEGTPVFLFVGRMMWYKNLKLILDSLKVVSDAGFDFKAIFIGDGVERAAISHYSKNIGIKDKTIFIGAVYDREVVRAFFSLADLLLFPSTYDTSGLVVKEAAACDCAALLVKGSCAAEGVEDGVSGILAEENCESCGKKIIEALKTEGMLERIGKAAGEKVYFSWEDAVALAYKRYEEIVTEFNRKKK